MTLAEQAWGTLLKMGDGATPTEAFSTVMEITELGGPSMEADQIEVTNHSSPTAWKEYIAGALDAGEISATVNFIPGHPTHDPDTGVIKKFRDRANVNWKLVFPVTPVEAWGFVGQVTGFETSEPVDEQLSAEITIKVSGEPDWAATP